MVRLKPTTVRLDSETWKRLKVYAFKNGIKLGFAVNEAIKAMLQRTENGSK